METAEREVCMKAETVKKPWGHETIIADEPTYGAKILHVDKGEMLSLQRHKERDETWFVLRGTPQITDGNITHTLLVNDIIQIARGTWHRLIGYRTEAVVLEVTNGYIDGDIERKDDKYGRKGTTD